MVRGLEALLVAAAALRGALSTRLVPSVSPDFPREHDGLEPDAGPIGSLAEGGPVDSPLTNPKPTKYIAGVPVYNYDAAHDAPTASLAEGGPVDSPLTNPKPTKYIAGVPVYNYDAAHPAPIASLAEGGPVDSPLTNPKPTKYIAGVPVYNYDGAHDEPTASLVEGGPVDSPLTNPKPTKFIAGVPVYNYDAAFKPERTTSFLQGVKGEKVEGQEHFVIMLKRGVADSGIVAACDAARRCTVHGHSRGVPYMEFKGTEADLEGFVGDYRDDISFVEPDLPMGAITEVPNEHPSSLEELGAAAAHRAGENPLSWGLDRIGVPAGGHPGRNGKGVHVYVLDSGIRVTHKEFGGRAVPTLESLGKIVPCDGNENCAVDLYGHGTHCAGIIGGKLLGVAPGATLHAVKVLTDVGGSSSSWVLGALDWVAKNAEHPAVVSMSLGGRNVIQAQRFAIQKVVDANITVVVAAGNDAVDACGSTPAFVPEAITVGATDQSDGFAAYSNYGPCVNILAPGSNIPAASFKADNAGIRMTGTSMACPHVAGAAALLLEEDPELTAPEILQSLRDHAYKNVIRGLLLGSPNRLLRSPAA